MKTKYFILAALVSFALFTSCDDDITNVDKHVPAIAQNKVAQAYPNHYVEWEYDRGMIKAQIESYQGDVNMWFKKDGTYMGIEKDYHGQVPEAITNYVRTNYPNHYIDDIDIWEETPYGTYFELELERNNRRDITIRLTEDGNPVG